MTKTQIGIRVLAVVLWVLIVGTSVSNTNGVPVKKAFREVLEACLAILIIIAFCVITVIGLMWLFNVGPLS